MVTMIHVNKLVTSPYSTIPFYDGQEESDSYYAKLRNINELARPLAVAGFNPLVRSNKIREKMTGRFHPVPVNNSYNANAPINNEAESLNWLQGKYWEVMVRINQDALRSLMNEKIFTIDTADTYEKRIKTYAQ
ncbi:3360_t:CDS:1, partial [Funneliformis geosporum]